ncbi:hypothetical protein NDQ72_06375 [Halomonas sp. KG2]|uniref:hypothetical protein n=1 Tax=Halomonas sp. KG2 TaxID=2951138 RepID=UPI0026471733|nr:hypothetical protein [Halomonas sp. KG2]WKD29565.1 hypothetical protein NDQ72_06375 [Halomonas sp. KG2]
MNMEVKSVIRLGLDENGIPTVCTTSLNSDEGSTDQAKLFHHLAIVAMEAIRKELERLDQATPKTIH